MAGRPIRTSLGFLGLPFLGRSSAQRERQGSWPPSIISMSVSVTVAKTPARPPGLVVWSRVVFLVVIIASKVGTDGDPPGPAECRDGHAGHHSRWVSRASSAPGLRRCRVGIFPSEIGHHLPPPCRARHRAAGPLGHLVMRLTVEFSAVSAC